MADYAALKVSELRKLLSERNLPQLGLKTELIKRLQDNDKERASGNAAASASKPAAEDEIDYEDDDAEAAPQVEAPSVDQQATATTSAPKTGPNESAPAAAASATTNTAADSSSAATVAVAATPAVAATANSPTATAAALPALESAKPADEDKVDEPPFSQHLAATNPDDEAARRLARAKRFGIPENTDEGKKTVRTSRFGLDKDAITKTLDSALPEGRLKRSRGKDDAGSDDGGRSSKRQSGVGAGGERQRHPRGGQRHDQRQGQGQGQGSRNTRSRNRGGSAVSNQVRQDTNGTRANPPRGQRKDQQPPKKTSGSILDDPVERQKAEARTKRFAS